MPFADVPLRIQRIDTRNDNVQTALADLRQRMSPQGDVVSEEGRRRTIEVFGEALSPQAVVARICEEVRCEGLPAVLRYSQKLDRADLRPEDLRVSQEELASAYAQADPDFLATVGRIRDNILEFQRALLQRDVTVRRPGVTLQQRYVPLERIGICVPGGAAAYPSTVLMTAVCAQAAGVPQIAVIAPPTRYGANHPDVLATCHAIGVTEVYRVGGAQGVAALAYGVEGLPAVDKIVGPGNLFVALAKKHVYGQVSIDSIAGPSEVVVIADETTRPDFVAADMLAQAEHAPGASLLVTWSDQVLEATEAELARQVARISRSGVTVQSLDAFGALIRVRDAEEACRIANLIAPEHLHVAFAGRRTSASAVAQRRCDIRGQLHARRARRLFRRSVARAADRRYGPLGGGPVRQRFPPRQQRDRLQPRSAAGGGPRHSSAWPTAKA